MSAPLNMSKHWFSQHLAYTMAKYGMSMCVLGMAEEFRGRVAVNALWPKTGISTAATGFLGGEESNAFCRNTDIMADAAYVILSKGVNEMTGQFLIDEDVLRVDAGVSDFDRYACVPENVDNIRLSFFIDDGKDSSEFDRLVAGLREPHGTLEELFRRLSARFSHALVNQVQATYVFYVRDLDNDTEIWYLDLKNGDGRYGRGRIPESFNTTTDVVLSSTHRKILYNLLDGMTEFEFFFRKQTYFIECRCFIKKNIYIQENWR